MRTRRLLVACTAGVAVCLVFIGLQQMLPIDDRVRATSDVNDAEIVSDAAAAAAAAGGGVKPFRYQSLRYNARMSDDTADMNGRPPVAVEWTKEPPVFVQMTPRAFADRMQTSRLQQSSKSFGGRLRRHKFARSQSARAPDWPTSIYYDPKSPPEDFRVWNQTTTALCSATSPFHSRIGGTASQIIAYSGLFAELRDVVVDRKYCRSERMGGELIGDVIYQDESAEYYDVQPGCFQLSCNSLPLSPDGFLYNFRGKAHLDNWLRGVQFAGDGRKRRKSETVDQGAKEVVFDGFAVAVVRYEYANLYHTTTDWYNAFLMMQFFGRTPAETNILLVDSHPFGALDSVWTRLFGSVTRLSALGRRTRFRQLVWSIEGYESPMTIYASAPYPPLFDEFRRHVLSSYNIEPTTTWKMRNCSAMNVLFVWRRDYLAHPRNPTGHVQRKIANERELIDYVQRRHPGFHVSGVQIDLLDVGDQLHRIVAADIVVGVHGAGLTHAIFMRSDAGLAEIYPNDIWSVNEHFQAIARWRQIEYVRWVNHDFELEDEAAGTLRVPPYVANALVGKLTRKLCSSGKTHGSPLSDIRHRSPEVEKSAPLAVDFHLASGGALPVMEFDLMIGEYDNNDKQVEKGVHSDSVRL